LERVAGPILEPGLSPDVPAMARSPDDPSSALAEHTGSCT